MVHMRVSNEDQLNVLQIGGRERRRAYALGADGENRIEREPHSFEQLWIGDDAHAHEIHQHRGMSEVR